MGGWSTLKKDWCCKNENKGCESEYDCDAGLTNFETGWSQSKQYWCCKNHHKGCKTLQFDCDAGLATWQHGWSPAKKEWCCTYRQKGWNGCQALKEPEKKSKQKENHVKKREVDEKNRYEKESMVLKARKKAQRS